MFVDWDLANSHDVHASPAPIPSSSIPHGAAPEASSHIATRWQRPLMGRYKCNIDAAFSSSLNRTGIGICIRDHDGSFVLAKTLLHPCLLPVDVGEALGLFSALQWLSDMQFDNVDFETDSKLTVDAFLSDRNDTAEFGCIITSCHSLFRFLFSNSRVEFVRRQANGVAYALAGDTAFLTSPAIYYDIPICIESLIINKML